MWSLAVDIKIIIKTFRDVENAFRSMEEKFKGVKIVTSYFNYL